jgi:2-polyprenyl-6-methoxyphenol hydroxylase-like FAD-dependent oxidoreductase
MLHEDRTEVLVVGAGPVGLVSALLLSQFGIETKIIDQEERTASRSYACALHPRTLELLERVGLLAEVLKAGHRVDRIGFYDGESRRAQIRFSELPVDFPFALVLPQSALESLLEQSLKKKIAVYWNHRLAGLRTQGDTVVATIEKLGQTAKGYIAPEWDWVVEKTLHTSAAFLLGADGHNSHVRQCLDIEYEEVGAREFFVVYEFESDQEAANEVAVVLDDATTNVLWPLPGNKYRWSFQWTQPEQLDERTKDRMAVEVIDSPSEDDSLHVLQKLVQKRAPWFHETIKEVTWSAKVKFVRRLAKRFGQGHCWLAGDAAHQTIPIGMQSMNVGLCEGEELADKFTRILRDQTSLDSLEAYSRDYRGAWQKLLGLTGELSTRQQAGPWVQQRSARIPPCIPASGDELARLLNQVGLESQ